MTDSTLDKPTVPDTPPKAALLPVAIELSHVAAPSQFVLVVSQTSFPPPSAPVVAPAQVKTDASDAVSANRKDNATSALAAMRLKQVTGRGRWRVTSPLFQKPKDRASRQNYR